ncbi:unnamed protein product [Adineta steineri]|uniref:Telomeric single stranded DNA binding POT1/Cdc13 domain-containing protein n=1 Tax=Adineta steineri TaxID=433720 RepID=A0A818SSC5_9BILA|nr:unnamed protein product [Adineta steineri]CAF3669948.1 unnamed protein product [Adineta steineri]CAF3699412.1 unnamed protein product [Adineta steineri]
MPSRLSTTITTTELAKKYEYKTINELYQLIQPSGAKWCFYGVVKFRREINDNCMLLGICDPTSYGKGPKGVSCLLYRESFAGMIELPVDIEIGHIIRLHRMKITTYKPESGCIQMKSSNYYSWLIFDSNDDTGYDPTAQSSFTYTFNDNDCDKIDELRAWLLSFADDETLNTELDFQFVLPEPKTFHEQSTQTMEDDMKNNNNTNDIISSSDDNGSPQFFPASDEYDPSNNRLHTDYD